jgi:hypothetical protein
MRSPRVMTDASWKPRPRRAVCSLRTNNDHIWSATATSPFAVTRLATSA